MRSKLTRMTGYFEEVVPTYLLYEFKDYFRMTIGTFQIEILSGNKSCFEPLTDETYTGLVKQPQTCCNCTWMYE